MAHLDYDPQLAKLVDKPPHGDAWLHEIKYDGVRIGCRIRGDDVCLLSRNGLDWTHRFPAIVEAATRLGTRDALIDGEAAVVLPDGRTSFQALQGARDALPRGATLVYFVFDLLRLDGHVLTSLPLEERKARLRALVGTPTATSRLRLSEHVFGSGEAVFEHACAQGLEGIISKRRDLPYQPGRHGGWVKTKCLMRQEFVIGGFTDPEGRRAGLGALLIGYYDARTSLIFCGRVGTGFTQRAAIELRAQLDRLGQPSCPFDPPPAGVLAKRAHWVRPSMVAEVAFAEWTSDGKIRHPSFQGLRRDKRATDVVRERPRTPR